MRDSVKYNYKRLSRYKTLTKQLNMKTTSYLVC